MVLQSDLGPRPPSQSIYPTADEPMVNLTWDTASAGWSAAVPYWTQEDEFNVYILRGSATTNAITNTRTLSLYKYNLISRTLSKLCNIAGSYNNGASNWYQYQIASGYFSVNLTYNYVTFAESNATQAIFYVADLNTGAILGSYVVYTTIVIFSGTMVFHANGKDIFIFTFGYNAAPSYGLITFNSANRTISVGTMSTIGGLVAGNAPASFPSIYPVSPTSITMTPTQRFLVVGRGYWAGSGPSYSAYGGLGFGLFDISTGILTPTTYSIYNTFTYSGSAPYGYNPGGIVSALIYDNKIQYIKNRVYSTSFSIPTNLSYYDLTFSTSVVTGATTASWNSSGISNGNIPGASTQRYDRKFFAHWDYNNNVWFCRGAPALGSWVNLGTTGFSPINTGIITNDTNIAAQAVIFTTSGLIVTGQISNTTTAAPVAFFPLMNSGG